MSKVYHEAFPIIIAFTGWLVIWYRMISDCHVSMTAEFCARWRKNQGVSSFLSCMMGVLREVVYKANSEKVMVNSLQNLTFKKIRKLCWYLNQSSASLGVAVMKWYKTIEEKVTTPKMLTKAIRFSSMSGEDMMFEVGGYTGVLFRWQRVYELVSVAWCRWCKL